MRRRTTTHILSWERFWTLFQSDERPVGRHGRAFRLMLLHGLDLFLQIQTFFSSHAMVMDWEMTSRSR